MIQGFSGGLLNRELIYNLDLPSFQRDFASLKTLDHGTGPAITFTRPSSATYFDADGVLQTAANDVARFDHDPVNGNSRGLLIEEARTNLVLRSEEFDNAYWLKSNGGTGSAPVVTANDAVAPDGTIAADKIVFSRSTNTGLSYIQSGNLAPTAIPYAGTLFIKAATLADVGNQIQFRHVSSTGSPLVVTLTIDYQRIVAIETGVAGTRRMEFGFISSAISETSVAVHVWAHK